MHSTTCEIEHPMPITADRTRGPPWCAAMLVPLSLKHVRSQRSLCFSDTASLDSRGVFAGRPSAAHARANPGFPIAPHLGDLMCIVAHSPAAIHADQHVRREAPNTASPLANQECLTLGIQKLKTR